MSVLVLLDHADSGALRATAPELVALGRTLGAQVEGVWVGAAPLPAALPAGLARVHRVSVPHDEHLAASLAEALFAVLDATGADVLLLAATFENKDVAARVGVGRDAGVVTDADVLAVEGGRLVAGKTVLAGTWTTRVEVAAPLAVVLVKAGAAAAEEPAGVPEVVEHAAAATFVGGLVEVVERTERAGTGRPDLASAPVVVVGGRGTDGDFGPLEELADVLGAAIGATRVATDEGWIAREAQIGQTGVAVSPRLYVGAGVSGAVHHRGGMQAAGTIVAINNDPDAPIFEIADYGVVGDLFEVLPQLTAELRRLRG
ncbi:MAG TPA: electron transfer flavoprotein subunit alpha/FixB family protein [Cellulomonas sp.]